MVDPKIIRYEHHGRTVAVREDLQGQHREHCLCWRCARFCPHDRDRSCEIASALYSFDVKHGVVTPVWECGEFVAHWTRSCGRILRDEERVVIDGFRCPGRALMFPEPIAVPAWTLTDDGGLQWSFNLGALSLTVMGADEREILETAARTIWRWWDASELEPEAPFASVREVLVEVTHPTV